MLAAQAGGGLEGAAGMALRPELAAHAAALAQRLAEVAARPGASVSALLIGPRGAGKTLARPPEPLRGRAEWLAMTRALLGAFQRGRRPGRPIAVFRSYPVRLYTSFQLGCSLHMLFKILTLFPLSEVLTARGRLWSACSSSWRPI